MFDILFRNAKVIDGTGNPWFYGDVGVEGGTVAAVLPPGSTARARRVADVDGKALCPGFVDGHSHSELPLLAGEGMDCKIMQGVTTENLGLDGMSRRRSRTATRPTGRNTFPASPGRSTCRGRGTASRNTSTACRPRSRRSTSPRTWGWARCA
ncbi:MAG: hypothetical protein ACLRWP_11060 [Bilophila wadsworthia]